MDKAIFMSSLLEEIFSKILESISSICLVMASIVFRRDLRRVICEEERLA